MHSLLSIYESALVNAKCAQMHRANISFYRWAFVCVCVMQYSNAAFYLFKTILFVLFSPLSTVVREAGMTVTTARKQNKGVIENIVHPLFSALGLKI